MKGFNVFAGALVVVGMMARAALAAPAPATIADAQADFSAGQYRPCLQKIAQALGGPTAKPGSPERYDLFMLRGEALVQLRESSLASDAFNAASNLVKGDADIKKFADARANAILIKASPGLRYTPKKAPAGGNAQPIEILKPEDRKAAMLALLEDRMDDVRPKYEQALKGTSLPPMEALIPAILDMYVIELAATGETTRTMEMAKPIGARARELINDAMQHITARTQELEELATSPNIARNFGSDQVGYRGLTSPERNELKEMAGTLVKIQQVAQNARRLSRRLGGAPEAWDALLADVGEAMQNAQQAYDRRLGT